MFTNLNVRFRIRLGVGVPRYAFFERGGGYDRWGYAHTNCPMRSGSSHSQWGFWAVASKIDEV